MCGSSGDFRLLLLPGSWTPVRVDKGRGEARIRAEVGPL